MIILKEMEMRPRRRAGTYSLFKSSAALVANDVGEMGLALIDQDGEIECWGLLSPHTLVQFYRGMQLLDTVAVIGDWTLCACYYAGARKPSEHGKDRIEFMEHNGAPDIRSNLKKIFRKPIPQEEIDDILLKAEENGVSVSGWELEDAVKAGDIRRSAMVTTFIHREQAEQSQQKIREYLAKKSLPLREDVSFEAFCRRVGLGNICDMPVGAYGFDWGHYAMDKLDETIIRLSLDNLPLYLYCSQNPEGSESFGAIGVPVFDTDDGRFVMERVKYNNTSEMMDVLLAPLSGELGERVALLVFESMEPKFVGVARHEKDRGYMVTEVELVLNREPAIKVPEEHSALNYVRDRMARLRNRLGL